MKTKKPLLCRLGFHRPLHNHEFAFSDTVSGKDVYYATCPCGERFMVDSLMGFFGFKAHIKNKDTREVK
jgi:hypothetical protein